MKKNYFLSLSISILLTGIVTFSCQKEKDMLTLGPDAMKSKHMPITIDQGDLTDLQYLGKNLFFDLIATPEKMSCATCHAPQVGFTGPDSRINEMSGVYPGVIHTRFGNRKPPSAAYGGQSPVLYFDEQDGLWIGGMFWDGRATGWTLGDPLAEQAQGPFLNDLEQNLPNAQLVILKVKESSYAELFEEVWGEGSINWTDQIADTYEKIARSISAYEKSDEVNPFSSKYDAFLAGTATLTQIESDGLALFNGKGKCALCHLSEGPQPLFTDFTYDNLGIPKNPDNPFYSMPPSWNPEGMNWVDYGLGGFLRGAGYPAEVYEPELGKHKVPSLRNVDLRPSDDFIKAYGHNGYFKSLKEITHFYNTRDVASEGWPAPEVPETINTEELGNLGLTDLEENAIVAFMKTLSDGYMN
jgi:cytochrome c peroxidase